MQKIVNKTVKMTLVGVDGNAFSVMGTFRQNALKQGWTRQEVQQVLDYAKQGDNIHLMNAIMLHIEEEDLDNEAFEEGFDI